MQALQETLHSLILYYFFITVAKIFTTFPVSYCDCDSYMWL